MNSRNFALVLLTLGLAACDTMGTGHSRSDGRYSDHQYRQPDSRYDSRDNYERQDSRNCRSCGVVRRIEVQRGDQRTSGGGAVLGAVVGGVLGNQIGHGDGRKAATVAGAVAGGFAGNAIERNSSSDRYYAITVHMQNGSQVVVSQWDLNGVREGSQVIIQDGVARLY